MIARLASSCICGSWVTPGMKIAFCSEIRRVTMCPACSPSQNKAQVGEMVMVGQYAIQAARTGGKVVAFVVRWSAGDSINDGYSVVRWVDGEWKQTSMVGWGPGIHGAEFAALLEQAIKAKAA